MHIFCVLLTATLYIVIWHGYAMYSIGSHDLLHPKHGYARLGETIVVLQMTPLELWSQAHLILYIGEDIVMYFSHQFLFWPHTLGGICYIPKIPYSCIHGLGPLTCIFFQRTVENNFLKNHFLEDVHALHHYILRTYAFCTTIASVHMLVAPLQPAYACKSCKEFVEIHGLLEVSQLIHLL